MPYIEQRLRDDLQSREACPTTPGELNFMFTDVIKDYLLYKGESYQTYNDIIGALDCCGKELYRRKIAPYEDMKINQNGDVY